MLGLLLNQNECKELEYLLRKELDEILFDLSDERLDSSLRKAMNERYQSIFKLFSRFAPSQTLSKYARNKYYD